MKYYIVLIHYYILSRYVNTILTILLIASNPKNNISAEKSIPPTGGKNFLK